MQITESMIPTFRQEDVNPEKAGDYYDEEGLLRCGVCGKRMQYHIKTDKFDKIVPCICDCRKKELEEEKKKTEYEERMRRIDRLKASSMMSGKYRDATFKNYIKRDGNREAHNTAVCYCKNWKDMYANNQGLLFYGPVGTGKSYTAACIANWLLDNSVPVIMTSFVKILQDIRNAQDEAAYLTVLNSAKLLIIDDLGAERNTEYAQEKVYNVVDSRVRANKPMILTTNLDLAEMMNCSDLRYKRTYDRILEACYPVEVKGTSMRMQEANKRYEDMQRLIHK